MESAGPVVLGRLDAGQAKPRGIMKDFEDFEAAASEIMKGHDLQVEDFDLGRTIGRGRYARVRLAELKTKMSAMPLCLKVMKKDTIIKLGQVDHIVNEKDVLGSVRHPFIIYMAKTFQDNLRLYMALELVNGGELFTLLRKEGRFKMDAARFFTCEIASAISYLHTMLICFRDLKPENILLHRSGHAKVTDFGFAKFLRGQRTFTFCGTPAYMAPEILQKIGHGCEVDWWAIGILLFEMLSGLTPFRAVEEEELFREIQIAHVMYPPTMDKNARDLISRLLLSDPQRRMSDVQIHGVSQFRSHPFFRGIDWGDVEAGLLVPPFVPKVDGGSLDTTNFEDHQESVAEVGSLSSAEMSQEGFSHWNKVRDLKEEALRLGREAAEARRKKHDAARAAKAAAERELEEQYMREEASRGAKKAAEEEEKRQQAEAAMQESQKAAQKGKWGCNFFPFLKASPGKK